MQAGQLYRTRRPTRPDVETEGEYAADIKAAYGQEQAPVWITYQVGAQYVRDKVAIGMAQLEGRK